MAAHWNGAPASVSACGAWREGVTVEGLAGAAVAEFGIEGRVAAELIRDASAVAATVVGSGEMQAVGGLVVGGVEPPVVGVWVWAGGRRWHSDT
jgi:hypothetical protein